MKRLNISLTLLVIVSASLAGCATVERAHSNEQTASELNSLLEAIFIDKYKVEVDVRFTDRPTVSIQFPLEDDETIRKLNDMYAQEKKMKINVSSAIDNVSLKAGRYLLFPRDCSYKSGSTVKIHIGFVNRVLPTTTASGDKWAAFEHSDSRCES